MVAADKLKHTLKYMYWITLVFIVGAAITTDLNDCIYGWPRNISVASLTISFVLGIATSLMLAIKARKLYLKVLYLGTIVFYLILLIPAVMN